MCVFKNIVKPSLASTKASYKVWIALNARDDFKELPCEEVNEAHCTCPVGLLGTCNHVAGVLFRVERAVVYGHVHNARTDHLCEWVDLGKRSDVPGRVKDTPFCNEKYGKISTRGKLLKRLTNAKHFKPYLPIQGQDFLNKNKIEQMR